MPAKICAKTIFTKLQHSHRQVVGRLHRWFSGSYEKVRQMKNFNGYSRYLTLFMAFLLSAWVAGCGGGGGGGRDPILGSGGATLAPIALTVTAVVPLANATGVPINTKIITAAF